MEEAISKSISFYYFVLENFSKQICEECNNVEYLHSNTKSRDTQSYKELFVLPGAKSRQIVNRLIHVEQQHVYVYMCLYLS